MRGVREMEGKLEIGSRARLGRELGQSLVVLGLAGCSVGGLLSILALATRALGR
jgi:hypothetical protein